MLIARRKSGVQPWKAEVVEELKELSSKHPVIGIADITGIPTAQVQILRKKLGNRIVFKVAKKNLILKALEELGVERPKIEPYIRGTPMLIYTDINPFKLYRILETEKVAVEAKPGQVTDREIAIPEGPTEITPGPMLGVLGRFKIPYEVRGGKVYIKKSTTVAKPGDVISPELASLLLKLDIKPFEIGVEPLAVYDKGLIIPGDALKLDIESVKRELQDSIAETLRLAASIGYLEIPEAASIALAEAIRVGEVLAENIAIPTPDLIGAALRKALVDELLIITVLGDKAKELGVEPPLQQPAEEEKRIEAGEEEREEKKEEELDVATGLESLFES